MKWYYYVVERLHTADCTTLILGTPTVQLRHATASTTTVCMLDPGTDQRFKSVVSHIPYIFFSSFYCPLTESTVGTRFLHTVCYF